MAKQLRLRRGTTAQHSTFTGAEGEATVDITKDTLVVHDGSTVGGHPLAKENLANVPAGSITTAMLASNLVAPSASTSTTQAAKTSDTTIATTAFVDRLRGLLTPTTGSGGGTAAVGDRGCLLSVTAGVTIPASVFAANDTFSIYNNSASGITITQGAGLTLRQVGTANTGNRTLAQRGLATVVFISATEAVISGGGLT